ncbi:MAG: phosphate acyltransferase PlsX, partial [Thermodesulfovibrio sp.]
MLKIAVDAMGGDFAPEVNILGAIEAASDSEIEIILVGEENKINEFLKDRKDLKGKISILHVEEQVGMDETVSTAIRRKNTSMKKA